VPADAGGRAPTGEAGQVAHAAVGEGPPLVLLHATLSSSRELRALAGRLAAAFRVTSVDRRGSGASALPPSVPPGPIDVAVHVDDLVALIEAERLAPVTLVGHSYGGCIALELAARHPRLVARVWAYEPPYAPVGPAATHALLDAVSRRTAEAFEASGLGAAAETFLASVAGEGAVAALSPQARERIRAQGVAAVADAGLLGLDPEGLMGIECPVTIATGTASWPAYAGVAEGLVGRIPGAIHSRIEGADHMAPLTRPETIATAVLEAVR
jgi:pimeloyl-ACP methyl ester carboxylesterase